MSGDTKARLTRSAVAICKELESGAGEVSTLYRAAEVSLSQGQADNAIRSATQALAKGLHKRAGEIMTTGGFLARDTATRAEMTAKEIIKLLRDAGDKPQEALALNVQADAYLLLSETTKALKSANAAVALFRRLDDKPGEAIALGSVINAHLIKATAGYNPQLEMAEKADEKVESMRQQRENDAEMALEAAKEVVTLFRGMGDRKGEAQALDKVANVLLLKEEPEQCKSVAREERSLYQELNDLKGETIALQTIIQANLQKEEDYDDALIAAKDVLKLYRGRDRKTDEDDKQGTADALHSLAKVFLQKYDLAEALESAEEALKLYAEAGVKKDGSAPCCSTLAQIHTAMMKPEEAIKVAKQAVEDYQDAGDRLGEAQALHELAVLDMEDLLSTVEKNPKKFSQEQADRLEAAWKPLEAALAAFRELKNTDGEYYVIETINQVIERSRQIHIRVAEPAKTVYITDPKTRETVALHIFDTVPPAMPTQDAEGDIELEDQ